MKFLLLLVVAVFVCVIDATSDSDPAYIYLCDARSSLWGCDPAMWINGDRLRCRNTSQIMSWASKPVRSNCYRIVAGDEASPATQYTPNEYIHIHVRVHCWKMLYRGLLMYAVDNAETKVGEWYLPFDEPALYDRPWKADTQSPCYRTVMHASAEVKPYHTVLHFKAPPAGTGRITFRTLIKYGEANTGAFYWPMLTDLALAEGPEKSPTIWYKSAVGQSCTQLCPTIGTGLTCSIDAFQILSSKQAVHQQLLGTFPCKLPILSGCGTDGASFDPVNEFCYYNDLSCIAQNRTISSVNCDTVIPDAARFCPCSVGGSATTAVPSPTSTSTGQATGIVDEEMSAAVSRQGWVMSEVMLLFVSMMMMSKKEMVVMLSIALVLTFGVSSTSAHNWINSNSRANGASAYTPCKPPITDIPHAQVGPGQAFQIEWMNGHGAYTYFAIMHSKDLDKMRLNTFALLDDYIAKAPNGSNTAQQTQYMKYHRKETPTLNNDRPDNITIANFFQTMIPQNDSRFIYRPASFGGRIGSISRPDDNDITYMMVYKSNELRNDIRVSYRSALYPWLEAVYKFQVVALHPVRPDTANFYIPGFGGPGRYVVQYLWRGYRDCIDIDYKPTPVAQIYGYPLNTTRWTRIDHCLFENVRAVYEVSEIVTDPQFCLDRCVTRGSSCYGVNVVPLMAPPTVYPAFEQPSGVNWMYPNVYGTDIYVPWNFTAFNASKATFMRNPSPTKYLCYAVQPAMFTDTMDDFTVSVDPEDPIYYSTCYYKLLGNMFDDYVNTTEDSGRFVPWRFNDKCIDCKTKSENSYTDHFPKWHLADTCINCDREPVNVPKPFYPTPYTVEPGVRCDGLNGAFTRATHHNCTNTTAGQMLAGCVKQLLPVGRLDRDVSAEECFALAARDPVCSDTIFRRTSTTPFRCYCYTQQPCCKTCSRRPDAAMTTYTLTNNADPTCSRGVLSANSQSCCSASCGANGCVANNATINAVGFCCSTCITRPCSQYGPPCNM